MRYRHFLLAAALAFSTLALCVDDALAGNVKQNKTSSPRWQDPSVNFVNREPMRASFIAFPAGEKAVAGADFRNCPSSYMDMGGQWKFFHNEDSYAALPEGFFKSAFDDSAWGTMPVPGLWELNGFGDPLYTNTPYPWTNFYRNNPPFVPLERNAVGLYRRSFNIPASWKGKDIFVHIGSATSCLTLWANGREAGYSEDSKLEAEFNLTSFVRPGADNLIVMEIRRWCDGSYMEDQDFWRLSGIGRDCYLYCRDKARLIDVNFTSGLDSTYTDGILGLQVEASRGVDAVEYVLSSPDGIQLLSGKCLPAAGTPKSGAKTFTASNTLRKVMKWSAESPSLYSLEVKALDAGGKVREHAAFNLGFRTSEIRGGQLLVNGKPVLIKGVNRHEMNARTGYYLTTEDMMKDIKVLKSLNINAVRCCHYPDDAKWYDLCDKYGFYLVDEGDIESHGMGYGELTLAKNPIYGQTHLERDSRMVQRDRNHPSIIVWSLGNESGDGPNFSACYDLVKSMDSSRPVQYEQAGRHSTKSGFEEGGRNTDIFCPMYANYERCRRYALSNPSKPLIQCEYAHAMGNSLGGLREYWDLVRAYPAYQGGFIWDFADQALEWKDPVSGMVTYRYGGDWNDRDISDGNFNCNGITDPEHNPHPGAWEVKYQYQNIWTTGGNAVGTLVVRNENFFVDLDYVKLDWEVLLDGKATSLKGCIGRIDVGPESSVLLDLGFGETELAALGDGEKTLVLCYKLKEDGPLLPAGYEVAHQQLALGGSYADSGCGKSSEHSAEESDDSGLDINGRTISGKGFELGFDAQGRLCSADYGGVQMLSSPFEFSFYRALTDNDAGVVERRYERQGWLVFRDIKPECRYFKITVENGVAVALSEYRLKEQGSTLTCRYLVRPDGSFTVEQEFEPSKRTGGFVRNLLREGLAFAMPGSFDTIEFYGAGPWETYPDRQSGAIVANYVQKVAGQFHHGYVAPGESGSHCGLRYWEIRDADGCGFRVSSDTLFIANALPYPLEQIDRRSSSWRSHPSELETDGLTHVNLDSRQSGLGCVNSWGELPLEQYVIPCSKHSWKFIFTPISSTCRK